LRNNKVHSSSSISCSAISPFALGWNLHPFRPVTPRKNKDDGYGRRRIIMRKTEEYEIKIYEKGKAILVTGREGL
jgi:hypothetical protein